jgi:hypothetical protein
MKRSRDQSRTQRDDMPLKLGRKEEVEEDEDDGVIKPSKLEHDDDLIAYVRQLELPISEMIQSLSQNTTLSEDNLLLIASVHKEIKKREASLITNKKCSVVMEKLLLVSSAFQISEFIDAILPYFTFASTNRFSSHVFETLFLMIYRFLSREYDFNYLSIDASHDISPNNDTSPDVMTMNFVNILVSITNQVNERIHELAFDTAGTHLLRSLIFLLSGLKPLSNKHKNATKSMEEENERDEQPSSSSSSTFSVDSIDDKMSSKFYESIGEEASLKLKGALDSLVHAMVDIPYEGSSDDPVSIHPIYQLACDSNASPVLQILLAVTKSSHPSCFLHLMNCILFSSSGDERIVVSTSKEQLKKRKREENKSETNSTPEQFFSSSYLQAMCCSSLSARVVETCLSLCDNALFQAIFDSFFLAQVDNDIESVDVPSVARIVSLANDSIGVFVAQKIILSCRSQTQINDVISSFLPFFSYFALEAKKEGLIWYLVASGVGRQVFTVEHEKQDQFDPSENHVISKIPFLPKFSMRVSKNIAASEKIQIDISKAIREIVPAMSDRSSKSQLKTDKDVHFIKWWFDLNGYRNSHKDLEEKIPGDTNLSNELTPIQIVPFGTRILCALFRYPIAISRPFLDSLFSLDSQDLSNLANDAYFSRHGIEWLISYSKEHPSKTESSWILSKLYSKFRSFYANLSCNKFSCWIITKLFEAVDVGKKSMIAKEILSQESMLSSNKQGRAVLKSLRIQHYKSNKQDWENFFEKKEKKSKQFNLATLLK